MLGFRVREEAAGFRAVVVRVVGFLLVVLAFVELLAEVFRFDPSLAVISAAGWTPS